MHSLLYLFADDIKCVKSIVSPLDSWYLQEDLNYIATYKPIELQLFGLSNIFLLSFKNGFLTSYISTSTIPCMC